MPDEKSKMQDSRYKAHPPRILNPVSRCILYLVSCILYRVGGSSIQYPVSNIGWAAFLIPNSELIHRMIYL